VVRIKEFLDGTIYAMVSGQRIVNTGNEHVFILRDFEIREQSGDVNIVGGEFIRKVFHVVST
jgi:hypothetical protein